MATNDPYNRAFTFTHDWNGALTLARTSDGARLCFQRGAEADAVDDRFDYLVGECGYDGQTALAMIWNDQCHLRGEFRQRAA